METTNKYHSGREIDEFRSGVIEWSNFENFKTREKGDNCCVDGGRARLRGLPKKENENPLN